MEKNVKSYQELEQALEAMRLQLEETVFRLEEATDTIEAIRSGEVDALVVNSPNGHQLYTLKSADQTYRIFIEQMTEGAITLNSTGNILYCNSRFASLIGLPLEKVTGQPFCNFAAAGSRQDCHALVSKSWETSTKGELNLSTLTGKELPVLLSLKTLDLDEGLSLSVIVTDLSEQKETHQLLQLKNAQLEEAQKTARHLNANLEITVKERTRDLEESIFRKTQVERELRDNQARLNRILDTMAEGVGIIDLQGNLTYANPMAQKILGLRKSETPGKIYDDPQWQHFKIDGLPLREQEHPMRVTIATGQPVFDYEIAIQPPGKERMYVSINAAPIRDEQGEIVAGVATFTDVTNRRKDIQHKDEFISVASHELKTPVTSLKAALQLLDRIKDNPGSGMMPQLIEQANKSLDKVSILIDDLLNATKITEGRLRLNRKQVNLASLVDDCCPHVRANAVYNIITTGDHELSVNADADKIDQVLVNLINNSIKYAPESKDIYVNIERAGNYAKLSVMDNGPGIPPEKLPNLFDRYYRVETNGNNYSGLGLGLYICAEIIKKHNGEIGAESEPGKGSTFWFTLPFD